MISSSLYVSDNYSRYHTHTRGRVFYWPVRQPLYFLAPFFFYCCSPPGQDHSFLLCLFNDIGAVSNMVLFGQDDSLDFPGFHVFFVQSGQLRRHILQ